MNSLRIRNLHKTFRWKTVALDGLDLDVPVGCIFGLLGPNGAGKSTAINIIAGVVRKNKGDIEIFGEAIGDQDYKYKQQVGFVLEKPVYIEKLSVKEYLEFAAAMYGLEEDEGKRRARELIEVFNLTEKQNKWIETYSSGMKKKVSLAAALIHHPKLLILDEPLEGIDPISAKTIKSNLRLMADRGITIVISSHVLDTIEKICDEIAIIHKGKRLLQSRTEELAKKVQMEIGQKHPGLLEEVFIKTISGETEGSENRLSWLDD